MAGRRGRCGSWSGRWALIALLLVACGGGDDVSDGGGIIDDGDPTAEATGATTGAGVDALGGADAASDPADGAGVGPPSDATPVGADVAPPEQVCPPESVGCVGGELFVCDKGGFTFEIIPCDDGLICVGDECVQCGTDADCVAPEQCVEGECVIPPLEIVTDELPPAVEDALYGFTLQGIGGAPPYVWSVHQGELPPGLTLSDDGVIEGATGVLGAWPMIIKLADDLGETETRPLTLKVLESGLHIVTASPLPIATDGEPYEVQLAAAGGTTPYIWGLAAGGLPTGLALGGDGKIFGVPVDDGMFSVTVKVFDATNPPLVATKDFGLPVTIAPLEIVSAVEVDLFVTKLIVLPLILIVEGIDIPYNAQLEAIGGKKPLHWAEDALPDLVTGFIPQANLPPGLTLEEDGTVTGAVSDPSLAVTITIPFVGIDLSGFFFQARVEDDQPVPFEDSALYIIPTVPISF